MEEFEHQPAYIMIPVIEPKCTFLEVQEEVLEMYATKLNKPGFGILPNAPCTLLPLKRLAPKKDSSTSTSPPKGDLES
jgi:hypothetical protein